MGVLAFGFSSVLINVFDCGMRTGALSIMPSIAIRAHPHTYLIIVADAADAVSVNFSDRCKFLQI